MKEKKNSVFRRNFLKTALFGGFATTLFSVNPLKLYSRRKGRGHKEIIIKVHPLAVKRNKKG